MQGSQQAVLGVRPRLLHGFDFLAVVEKGSQSSYDGWHFQRRFRCWF
jgi:hypothetical protein